MNKTYINDLSSPGLITVDGHDIRDLNPYWLRSHIGTVSQVMISSMTDLIHWTFRVICCSHTLLVPFPLIQEPTLFSCSVRDNIAYGALDPEAVTAEDIHRAARVANAYDFIQAFPKGFDTVVGEKGVLLSGKELRHLCSKETCIKIVTTYCFSHFWLDHKYLFTSNLYHE